MTSHDTGAGHGFLRLTSWRFRVGLAAGFFATFAMLALVAGARASNGVDDPNVILGILIALGVDVWIILAILSGKGRRVALGFLCGVIGLAMVRPPVVRVWGLPVAAVVQATRPAWAPLAAAGAQSEKRTAWARARSGDAPAIIHAQRLINFVHECAASYRAADSLGGYPRSATDLAKTPDCGGLAETRLGNDSARTLYDSQDFGWRWSYAPSTSDSAARVTGYTIAVLDDPLVQRSSPRYSGDETGRVQVTDPGQPPRIVLSPVRDLAQLRRCLQRVPAEHERVNAQYGWERPHDPLYEVASVCPELKGHYSSAYPDREHGALALSARNTAGEIVDTVAVYTIELIPADVEGIVFELQARPRRTNNPYIHAGSRRFFVARDGSIHVGTGPGPATISDPLAEECVAEPDLCSDRLPDVRRAPGS